MCRNYFSFFILLFLSYACFADTVILVHGLGRDCGSMNAIEETLELYEQPVYCLNYDSLEQDFFASTQQVRQQLIPIIESQDPHERFHFVGHSMGGLISFFLYNELSSHQQGSCTTLGSPFLGSPAAKLLDEWAIVRFFQGPALTDLKTPFLTEEQIEKQYRGLLCIAGDQPSWWLNILYFEENPHDGMVTVTSAIPNPNWPHLIIPRSHNGLLYDQRMLDAMIHNINPSSHVPSS